MLKHYPFFHAFLWLFLLPCRVASQKSMIVAMQQGPIYIYSFLYWSSESSCMTAYPVPSLLLSSLIRSQSAHMICSIGWTSTCGLIILNSWDQNNHCFRLVGVPSLITPLHICYCSLEKDREGTGVFTVSLQLVYYSFLGSRTFKND